MKKKQAEDKLKFLYAGHCNKYWRYSTYHSLTLTLGPTEE